MSVTIKDVAKEVGVAPSTVSRTLQDHPSISKETKERVRKAMARLGYVPNIAAQNLAKNFANTVGVILPVMDSKERQSNPFYLEVMSAMNEEARKQKVTVAMASGSTQEELLESVELMYRQKRVDGFVLLYVKEKDPVLDYLVQMKVPFTIIGNAYKYSNEASCVDNDNQLLGYTATRHLIEKGHQQIIFVTNNRQENFVVERFEGYLKALKEFDLPQHPEITLIATTDYSEFSTLMTDLKPTACLAIDDMFALRLIQMLNYLGYQVPDDLSLISFNSSIFTTLIHPYITSLDINTQLLGKTAIEEFLIQLKAPDAIKKRVIIPHKLIEQETVICHQT
ncbi:LacI family DNA-binding transcriptional regulator [Vagococcus sp.]|uniref:LacI family DNA-binding transcriptional regulator n=1 Tax=Vagococcus sp. TaxID=1933889 RepID=UPI003F9D6697